MAQDTRLPKDLVEREQTFIAARRRKTESVSPAAPAVGLALSGGGIRSATFSLGVLQGLARLGLLKRFDYISTVSGGGYAGSFLGGLYCRPAGSKAVDPALVEAGLAAPQAPQDESARAIHDSVDWLRENGRYLTPGGSGDAFWAAAMMLRNLVAVHVVMGLLWLLAFMAADQIVGRTKAMDALVSVHLWGDWVLHISPWLPLVPLLALLALPLGWAYWLVRQSDVPGRGGMVSRPWLTALIFAPWALMTATAWMSSHHLPALGGALFFAGAIGVGAFLAWLCFGFGETGEAQLRLTAALRLMFLATIAALAFVAVDTLGWTLHAHIFPAQAALEEGLSRLGEHLSQASKALSSPGGVAAGASALLVAFKGRIEALFSEAEKGGWSELLTKILLNLAAGIVALLGLAMIAALAHAFSFGGALPAGPTALHLKMDPVLWSLAIGLVAMNVLLGRTIGFLNLSTLGPTYTAALTRAYVGASNPNRRAGDSRPHPIEGDDLAWADYRPWEHGGPLHLINVTLNETTGGRSQVIQKDRKGMNLAVGPAGISVGVRHHALWEKDGLRGLPKDGFAVFPANATIPAESLTVGQWVGISGAAFSTGLGSRTSWATSLLAGFLNVRLGYWWWSAVPGPGKEGRLRAAAEAALPVQVHLLEEWLAHFPGTHSRHWYLSDGGHFENTAVYELIRRRLPFIVLCDDGADPGRSMGDLANLTLKARLDFATRITVLDEAALKDFFSVRNRPVPTSLGSLDQMSREDHPAMAVLARLEYLGDRSEVVAEGLLLLLKPTRTPDLPLDVSAYGKANPLFPQESTADQFYDEAQWESYRALGEHMASTVFHQAADLIP